MTVSYLIKTTSGNRHGVPLGVEDWDYLRKVWCDLPPYLAGMTQQKWRMYESVFNASDGNPGWHPEPVWNNPRQNNAILRADAKQEYERSLRAAIRQGSLVTYTHAMIQLSPLEGDLPAARVPIDLFATYAEKFRIRVTIRAAPEPNPTNPREEPLFESSVSVFVGVPQ